ncbi:hypothetical protein FACS1894158_04080 [Betaproteobacteria bacterium]|nr:hypothetical protein FACS1894158_04080 [Betaproteobacteria bacterium]GHU17580.1 hypothetical protein FACS189475_01630 [Betaproteobacteria bacterium]
MLGGIKIPKGPEAVMTAAVNARSYPALSISGATTEPTAAAVAGPDPETAPKKMQAKVVTIAMEPLT